MVRAVLAAFSAVFSVADPLGLVPVYLAMTRGYAPARRRRTAVLASAAMFVTPTIFTAVGPSILHFFGLSIGAWQKTAIYIAIGLASVATALVLLAAIAVQFIVDGIGDVLPALRAASTLAPPP